MQKKRFSKDGAFALTLIAAALAVSPLSAQEPAKPAVAPSVNIPAVPVSVVRDGAADAKQALNEASGIKNASRVQMRPGQNVMIPIAVNHPNRIITPFKKPQVMSTTLTGGSGTNCGEVCVRGSIVYISTDKTYPVTAFITENGNDEVALSLTMIPKRIPPREVTLAIPDDVAERVAQGITLRGDSEEAEAWETSQPYTTTIREAFTLIAKGQVPQGYTLRKVLGRDKLPVCRQPGLDVDFRKGQVLQGHNLSVIVGTVRNISDKPIEFREQTCGSWNVAAVAAWPLKILRPDQMTEIYVAVKPDEGPAPAVIRKPLIKREYN